LLGVSVKDLGSLCSNEHYNVFPKRMRGKERIIEQPTGQLERVHRKLQVLLQRIESQDYLFSGKKGVSSIDNAMSHLGQNHMLALDIAHFFPSCKSQLVYDFFRYHLKTSPDIASLLSEVTTYNGHVPTGSSLSMSIAYWACWKTFQTVHSIAQKYGVKFTLYVDDMTFSSAEPLPRDIFLSVNHRLNTIGLSLKKSKTRVLSANDHKVVTGVALTPQGEARVPNRTRLKILKKLSVCRNLDTAAIDDLRSLLGIIVSARRIEPHFLEATFLRVRGALVGRT
jgi:Reverse transcriptase (RNA-dependent DNA polymerase)